MCARCRDASASTWLAAWLAVVGKQLQRSLLALVNGTLHSRSVVESCLHRPAQLTSVLCSCPTRPAPAPRLPPFMQKLRPQHTLALLLLACWQQGEAGSPLDVARWALDGHLPYLSFAAVEAAALQHYKAVLGRRLMTPSGTSCKPQAPPSCADVVMC